jgi:hypothetical protein
MVPFYDVGEKRQPEAQMPAANVTVRISGEANGNGHDCTDTTDSNGDFAIAGGSGRVTYPQCVGRCLLQGSTVNAQRLIFVAPGAEVKQNLIVTPSTDESGGAASTPPPPPLAHAGP